MSSRLSEHDEAGELGSKHQTHKINKRIRITKIDPRFLEQDSELFSVKNRKFTEVESVTMEIGRISRQFFGNFRGSVL